MTMHWLDWMILAVPMVIVTVIGIKTQQYCKAVSDFLAAGRSARRYLLTVAEGMAWIGLITLVAWFEKFYKSGFAIQWWEGLYLGVQLLLGVTGFVIYRYRETRAMTMAQFFEIRYSRRFRIFAGVLGAVSGIVNYAIFPAVGGRFFVYYCGLPETVRLFGIDFQTFGLVMLAFLSLALLLVTVGGQLTVLVTDCVQGLFGYAIILVIIYVLFTIFSWSQITETLTNVPKDQSLLDPFRQSGISDFNIWFVLINVFGWIYAYMAWQGGAGFNCSAESPHEAKMGRILAQWRILSITILVILLAVCSYTYLHHPAFADGARQVTARLATIDNPQIQTQMRVPVTLAHFLPVGIKGAFAALMLFLLVTTDVSYLHSWGSILIQDIVLPMRKTPFKPERQILYLRLAIAAVAVFAFFFSLWFRQTDYILMFFAATGTLYLGGAGAVIIGGLYWKKGTAAGAWCAMVVGCVLGVGGIVFQQVWHLLAPTLMKWFPTSSFLMQHQDKFPINGQWLWLIAMLMAIFGYVGVSLLTCRRYFDMDRMLHRGRHADVPESEAPVVEGPPRSLKALLGIDEAFSRSDKWVAYGVFWWGILWLAIFGVVTAWNLLVPWPVKWWVSYWYWAGVVIPVAMGVVTSIWFTIGGISNLQTLFRRLRTMERNVLDDGRVIDHQNVDDIAPAEDRR